MDNSTSSRDKTEDQDYVLVEYTGPMKGTFSIRGRASGESYSFAQTPNEKVQRVRREDASLFARHREYRILDQQNEKERGQPGNWDEKSQEESQKRGMDSDQPDGDKLFQYSEVYPGTVAHFRALLDRLQSQGPNTGWVSSSGKRLIWREERELRYPPLEPGAPASFDTTDVTPPIRGSWLVRTKSHVQFDAAGIEAYEQSPYETRVDFRDGYQPYACEPQRRQKRIGPAFAEFTEWIVGKFPPRARIPTPNLGGTSQLPTGCEQSVDVLLVTVTKVEGQAVLRLIREKYGREAALKYRDQQPFYDLGKIGGAKTIMVRSEQASDGPSGSTAVVLDAISTHRPFAVIMVGIAFGMNPKEQKIGEILVSRWIRPYEVVRAGMDDNQSLQIIPREDRVPAPPSILERFRAVELHWNGARLSFGLLLSGPVLVDNLRFRNQLRKLEPEAIGGEMEGAGLYSAAYRRGVDWIVVKAICDWADGEKHKRKQQRQALAAQNAAEFTNHVLEQGGFAANPPLAVTEALVEPVNSDLQSWERTRVIVEDRRQYFVHEAERHYLDPGAAKACDAFTVPARKLTADEEPEFLKTVPKGGDYNITSMLALLARLYSDRVESAQQVIGCQFTTFVAKG